MSVAELFELLKNVILSREVIIITVVIALYLNFVLYVERYRKRPAGQKKMRKPKKESAPKTPDTADADGDEEMEDTE